MNMDCDLSIVPEWMWGLMTVLQEARNQNLDGMIAVAEVIRDRTLQRFYSDGTVSGTVLHPYQFSGWNSKDPNRVICSTITWDDPRVQMAVKAWNIAVKNKTNVAGGALFYHSKHMSPFPDWALSPTMKVTARVGDHIFYREEKKDPGV